MFGFFLRFCLKAPLSHVLDGRSIFSRHCRIQLTATQRTCVCVWQTEHQSVVARVGWNVVNRSFVGAIFSLVFLWCLPSTAPGTPRTHSSLLHTHSHNDTVHSAYTLATTYYLVRRIQAGHHSHAPATRPTELHQGFGSVFFCFGSPRTPPGL